MLHANLDLAGVSVKNGVDFEGCVLKHGEDIVYRLLRSILFRFDSETIHGVALRMLDLVMGLALVRRIARGFFEVREDALTVELWGLTFDNPVGLAAGFDKNAQHTNALGALGFGFIEIGTVTGLGQSGNPAPRMFRLRPDEGLLNRMGFNNDGSEAVAKRLDAMDIEPLLGVNIGKTKVVALEDAPQDYERSFRRLYPYARYFVVNVSSPNTPNLRELQEREPLMNLMGHLAALNGELASERGEAPRPLLLKIAPDIHDALLQEILSVIDECGVDGVIATNTTIEREQLSTPGQQDLGPGGVSGRPVRRRSLEIIRAIYAHTAGGLPIIGVGGIFTPEDALETIEAGASLVQVWTGFVYEGPFMVRRINKHLARVVRRRGLTSVAELVGASHDPSELDQRSAS
ncbi:MAG: quinone-dependent dihydroorotate dehydrogenase [Myxococcota bacterium]